MRTEKIGAVARYDKIFGRPTSYVGNVIRKRCANSK
jgi:hypothetical protein